MLTVPSSLQKVGQTSPTVSGLTTEQDRLLQQAALLVDSDLANTGTIRTLCKSVGVTPDTFAAWFNPKSDLYNTQFTQCWKLLASGYLEQFRPLLVAKVLQSALKDEKNSAKDRETALKMTGDIKTGDSGGGVVVNTQVNVSESTQKVVEVLQNTPEGEDKDKILEALKTLSKLK